jgi:hypothetical protein
MSKVFLRAKRLFRRHQHEFNAQSSTSSRRKSSEEMEIATCSLIDSMRRGPIFSLGPDSATTGTINLGLQSAYTTYSQPERFTGTSKSVPETVASGSNFPGQTSLTSTKAAGQSKLDHCATIFSSGTHRAVDLVVDILTATYSKCFIYPEGQFKFPDIRPVRAFVNLDAQIARLTRVNLCLAFARQTATRGTNATACICIKTQVTILKTLSRILNN